MKVHCIGVHGIVLMSLLSVFFLLVYSFSFHLSVTTNVALRTGSSSADSGDVPCRPGHSANCAAEEGREGTQNTLAFQSVVALSRDREERLSEKDPLLSKEKAALKKKVNFSLPNNVKEVKEHYGFQLQRGDILSPSIIAHQGQSIRTLQTYKDTDVVQITPITENKENKKYVYGIVENDSQTNLKQQSKAEKKMLNVPNSPVLSQQKKITEKPTLANLSTLGFLVILNIPEQLTAATEDFVQLYMVNQRHWKLGMIEPYVLGSALSFVPPAEKEFLSLRLLSKYLNRRSLINNLQACFYSDDVKLESFPQFLIDAARHFVIVNFVTHHNPRQPMDMTKSISECDYRDMNKTQSLLNYHLHKVRHEAMSRHGTKYKFVGVHSLCVKALPRTPFSMLQVVEYIKQWRKTTGDSVLHFPHFTIVIPEWRAIHSYANNHYYYDPSYTNKNLTGQCHLKVVPSSSYITRTTNNVFKKFSLCRPIIAVHVRTEKVASVELEGKIVGFIDHCLKQFSSALETIIRIHNVSREHVIFIHDGGKYGSSSMWKSRRNASNYIVANISSLGIRNVQYSPEKRANNATVDRALAQFVDRELLVSADVLITVGFGGFQLSIIEQFKNRKKRELGRKGELYRVCSGPSMMDILPSPS